MINICVALPWVVKKRAAKPDAARNGVAAQQAERLRLANAEKRLELLRADAVRSQVLEACAMLKQVMDAMPQRVTQEAALQDKVENECRFALEAFSKALESLGAKDSDMAVGSDFGQTGAEENSGGMGGSDEGAPAGDAGAGAMEERTNAIHAPNPEGFGEL